MVVPTCDIRIRGLDFSFKQAAIFHDFSFEPEGNPIVLRGPSGIGKTTLLKLIQGSLHPQRTTLFVVPKKSTFILQDDSLTPWLSGRQNIELFAETPLSRLSSFKILDGIDPLLTKKACEMSFGQRRLIEITRAFLSPSSLVLLDEPFNYLDETRRSWVIELLTYAEDIGKRVILTSHFAENVQLANAVDYAFKGNQPFSSLHLGETGQI